MFSKKILFMISFIFILSGCSWFKYYDRSQQCDELLERSKIQLEQANHLIDSLYTRTLELENANP